MALVNVPLGSPWYYMVGIGPRFVGFGLDSPPNPVPYAMLDYDIGTDHTLAVTDDFIRPDSATDINPATPFPVNGTWTVDGGVWGITGNRGYLVSGHILRTISDNFNRPNSTITVNPRSDGGLWSVPSGVVAGIDTNRGYIVSGGGTLATAITADAGSASQDITFTNTRPSTSGASAVIFAYDPLGPGGFYLLFDSGSFFQIQGVGGTFSVNVTGYTSWTGGSTTIRVKFDATTGDVELYQNGSSTPFWTYTLSTDLPWGTLTGWNRLISGEYIDDFFVTSAASKSPLIRRDAGVAKADVIAVSHRVNTSGTSAMLVAYNPTSQIGYALIFDSSTSMHLDRVDYGGGGHGAAISGPIACSSWTGGDSSIRLSHDGAGNFIIQQASSDGGTATLDAPFVGYGALNSSSTLGTYTDPNYGVGFTPGTWVGLQDSDPGNNQWGLIAVSAPPGEWGIGYSEFFNDSWRRYGPLPGPTIGTVRNWDRMWMRRTDWYHGGEVTLRFVGDNVLTVFWDGFLIISAGVYADGSISSNDPGWRYYGAPKPTPGFHTVAVFGTGDNFYDQVYCTIEESGAGPPLRMNQRDDANGLQGSGGPPRIQVIGTTPNQPSSTQLVSAPRITGPATTAGQTYV